MSERHANEPDHDDSTRVDEVLGQLRAGVRQRRAELATLEEEIARLPPALAEAHRLQYVHEPENVSHRPVIGRLFVLGKKVVYQAFMKWFMSSVIEQQNAFNRAVTEAMRDLHDRQRDLAGKSRRIEEALDRLEPRTPGDG